MKNYAFQKFRSVRQIIVKCIEVFFCHIRFVPIQEYLQQYEQCEKEHREIQNILIDFKNMVCFQTLKIKTKFEKVYYKLQSQKN